jgi:tetratricopeptide (TPR) repeat protein
VSALYEQQGRIDDAIGRYDTLYKTNAHSQQLVANNLAMLLVNYKKDPSSLDRARDLTAAFASSNDGVLLDTHGWVRFKRGELQDALAVLERAAQRAPDSKEIRYHLALAELKAGQKDRARENLEAALSGSANFTWAAEARSVLASLKGAGAAG